MTADEGTTHFLMRVPYFADVNATTLAAVAARCRLKSLQPKELVFMEGAQCQYLHILVKGFVNCYRASAEGREQIVTVFDRPGDTFCIPSAFTTGRNILTARTQAETRLCLIDRETFVDLARRHPPMALKLVAAASDETKKVIDLAESLSLKTVKVRLANLLYDRAMAEGVRGKAIRLTRDRLREEDIAAMVGTVRVHISRSLQSLARAGTIMLDRGVIRIPDLAALERVVEGNGRLSDRTL
ncbi:MAG: Crp/Fnr family transcriptional regulator [Candidatus Methylomirabilales bacterium]